jgi:hypothetical protein
MGLQETIDSVGLSIFLVFVILSMILMIEFGYQGGKRAGNKSNKDQMAELQNRINQ